MRETTPRAWRALTVLALVLLLRPPSAVAAEAREETPLEAATRFARAFESQDFATVRALFAPGAAVSRVELGQDGTPRFHRFSSEAWTADAERNHVYLKDMRLEILDSATQTLEQGAVVNLRYRFSGKAGSRSFVSNGIDTYSLIRVDGAWRVLQYDYFEKLDFF